MIRINLLENSKGKNKRAGGSGAPTMPAMEMGEMGSPMLKLLLVVIVAGAVNFGWTGRPKRLRCRCRLPSRRTANSAT